MLPSGEQIEIESGDQRAVLVEVGGGLRAYEAGGRAVLDGYASEKRCTSGRGQVLTPWPNRLQDGSYEFDGRRHQLPVNEVDKRDAIHGLVRWSQWSVVEEETERAVLEHRLYPTPGYPFMLDLRVEYSLSEDGLEVRAEAANVGFEPCPYGTGAHPYLAAGDGFVDSLELSIPARTALISDERAIPVGRAPVEAMELDFRTPRRIGAVRLDHCFTDLEHDDDGRARVRLRDVATLWLDESYPYVMVFTGDPLPDVARRSVAVEPMTCAPNAFQTGEGLIRLEPGQSHSGSWGIVPST